MSADLNINVNTDDVNKGLNSVVTNLERVDDANKKLGRTDTEVSSKMTQGQLNIKKAIEGTLTSTEKLEKQINDLKVSTSAAEKETEDYVKSLSKLQGKLDDTKKSGGSFGDTLSKFGGSTGSNIAQYGGEVSKLAGSFGAMAGPVGIAVGAVAVFGGALVSNASAIADNIDKIDKLAVSTGLSTEEFSRYQVLAQKSDLDMDKLSQVFGKLNEKVFDNSKIFKNLGISLTDASGKAKTTDEIFLEVAEAIASIQDPATQSALATKIWGDDLAKKLLPSLKDGAEGIKNFKKQNDDLKLSLSSDAVKAATGYTDAVENLGLKWQAFTTSIGVKTIPILKALASALDSATGKTDIGKSMKIEGFPNLDRDSTAKPILVIKLPSKAESALAEAKAIEETNKALKDQDNKRQESAKQQKEEDARKKKAQDEEIKRVNDLTKLISGLDSETQNLNNSTLEGADKIKATYNEQTVKIEEQRNAALLLAKTEQERANINKAADEAIVASRDKATEELIKLSEKDAAAAKAAADQRVLDEIKASNEIQKINTDLASGKTGATNETFDKAEELRASGLISEEEYIATLDNLNAKKEQEALKAQEKKEQDDKKKKKEQTKGTLQAAEDVAVALQGITTDLYDKQVKEIEKTNAKIDEKKQEQAELQEKILNGTASNEDKARKLALDAEILNLEERKKAQVEAATTLFNINKALQVSQAVINTAQAIIAALTVPPPVGQIASIAAGVVGAASVATILATPAPSFHTGGVVVDGPNFKGGSNDEVLAIVKKGERVLTEQQNRNLERSLANNSINSGGSNNPSIKVALTYKHKEFDTFIIDNLNKGGPLKKSIKGDSKVGHTR